MRIAVLGSGSRGNAVALEVRGSVLLLDAGFSVRSLTKRVEAVDMHLGDVVGVVLTHEHGDHARGAFRFAEQIGCPVYASRGTLSALGPPPDGIITNRIRAHQPLDIGPYRITACPIAHDAAEPIAIMVEDRCYHAKIGLAYDVGRPSSPLRALLGQCHSVIIEANHDDGLLRASSYPRSVQQRIAGSGGHLSNEAAARLLADLCHDGLGTVVLAHLSDQCNSSAVAADTVRRALAARGFRGNLLVAHQDQPLTPFDVLEPNGQLSMELDL